MSYHHRSIRKIAGNARTFQIFDRYDEAEKSDGKKKSNENARKKNTDEYIYTREIKQKKKKKSFL